MNRLFFTRLTVVELTVLFALSVRAAQPGTFAYDAEFLGKHTTLIVLADGDARVAVAPDYQGRVMTSTTSRSAAFRQEFALTNYSGTTFNVRVERTVSLFSSTRAGEAFGIAVPATVKAVAYETDNRLTNIGGAAWTKETGLLSIWLLGMYKPAPGVTIVIPFKPGTEAALGPHVNDTYFGKIPMAVTC